MGNTASAVSATTTAEQLNSQVLARPTNAGKSDAHACAEDGAETMRLARQLMQDYAETLSTLA